MDVFKCSNVAFGVFITISWVYLPLQQHLPNNIFFFIFFLFWSQVKRIRLCLLLWLRWSLIPLYICSHIVSLVNVWLINSTYSMRSFVIVVGISIRMQRILLITLLGTQEPTVIQGYAFSECTRDTFKSVTIFAEKLTIDSFAFYFFL